MAARRGASFNNYGPGAGGGAYSAYGIPGTYQNQPGLSELGGPRSQNIWNEPDPQIARQTVLEQWAQLQRQYPQYTNHANVKLQSNDQIHRAQGPHYNALAFGGPGPNGTPGDIVLNSDYLNQESPATVRGLLLKELGQVMSQRMLGTPAAADQLMKAWGYAPKPGDKRYPSGLGGAGWNGDTSNLGNDQINIGGYKSYPEDTYGIAFARALGANPSNTLDNTGILQGPALARLQAMGMLPRPYAPPTTPQMPAVGTNDMGRRGVQQPVPTTYGPSDPGVAAKLVAIQQMSQRNQQQNSANLAMRGAGPRTF